MPWRVFVVGVPHLVPRKPLHARGEGGDEGDVLTKSRDEPIGGSHHPQLLVDGDVGEGAAATEDDGPCNHAGLEVMLMLRKSYLGPNCVYKEAREGHHKALGHTPCRLDHNKVCKTKSVSALFSFEIATNQLTCVCDVGRTVLPHV